MTQKNPTPPPQPQQTSKKTYVPPEVVKYGKVKDLTRGTGSTATESQMHSAKKAGRN